MRKAKAPREPRDAPCYCELFIVLVIEASLEKDIVDECLHQLHNRWW